MKEGLTTSKKCKGASDSCLPETRYTPDTEPTDRELLTDQDETRYISKEWRYRFGCVVRLFVLVETGCAGRVGSGCWPCRVLSLAQPAASYRVDYRLSPHLAALTFTDPLTVTASPPAVQSPSPSTHSHPQFTTE